MTAPQAAQPDRPTTPRVVGYAPPQPAWRRRTVRRRVVIALVLLAVVFSGWRWGPGAWDRAMLFNLQRRCLTATAPPDRVVYDADPARRAALLALDPQYESLGPRRPTVWSAQDLERFYELLAPPGRQIAATLFVGERATPGGARRLVIVEAWRNDDFVDSVTPNTLYLLATVIVPGSPLTPPREAPARATWARVSYLEPSPDRMFAGQRDPADPSHFTIDYTVSGVPGVIDGWLLDDESVKLEPRRPVTPPPPPSAASPRPRG